MIVNNLSGLTESLTESNSMELLEKYILGEDKTGRPLNEIFDFNSFKDEENTIRNASTTVICMAYEPNLPYNYFKYRGGAYMLIYEYATENDITKSLQLAYVPQGREGTKVKYDSNNDEILEDWIIITDREGKLEILSEKTMYDSKGYGLTLGVNDESVVVTTDLDGDGIMGNDADKAILSYNNAIKTINDFCDEIVTVEDNDGVRSIVGNQDTTSEYESENFDIWYNGNEIIKDEDMYFVEELLKMHYWNIKGEDAWLPSRFVLENYNNDNIIRLLIKYSNCNSGYGGADLVLVSEKEIKAKSKTCGVRPVVINPINIEYID